MDIRVGIGYDVHRLIKDRKLILGGVNIDYEYGLQGHSDADVLTHAIIDSILGAMGKGDIGTLFPDSDDEYKDINSMILLKKVMEILDEENYEIVNLDTIIIAEKPKLLPYRELMVESLCDCMGIVCSKLNIKATTEEGLGFTGEKKGISAKSIVLIKRKNLL